MTTDSSPIGRGERAPDFALPRDGGEAVRLYGIVGGQPAVLVFAAGGGPGGARRAATALRDAVPPGVEVHLVTCDAELVEGSGGFLDADGKVHDAYGVPPEGAPTAVVVDPNVRVAVVVRLDGQAEAPAAVTAAVRAAAHDASEVTLRRHAPVLLVPDALDAALCEQLVQRWESAETVETGVEASHDGSRREVADVQRKRRRDHTVTDPDLLRTLTGHLGRRIMPELAKAFAYRATRFEGFKIGGYEATTQGFFEAHRDNLSPATAHRRFALTLNLNEDYDGGELRFPEYGLQRYRPAAGEALVFSGAHLHEVLPVTRGRRLVLLSFLFGDRDRRR